MAKRYKNVREVAAYQLNYHEIRVVNFPKSDYVLSTNTVDMNLRMTFSPSPLTHKYAII